MKRASVINFKFSCLVALFCLCLILTVGAARAATITVTSNADSGGGTLREAILASNASTGVLDEINFSGVTSIALATPLPAITDPVFINGGTTPAVELNGAGTHTAGIGSIGLWVRAGGTTIRGMIVNRFAEAGIRMDSDGAGIDNGNTITASVIGANQLVDTALPNINRGILIVGTTGHNIGGGNIADRNFISGNLGRGIEITTGGSATIRGNYIGTDGVGTGDLGNTSHGIQIVNSSGSTVGGTNNGVTDRNVISGNNGNGVMIVADFAAPASNNVVLGNYIGVDAAGSMALANEGSGVVVQAADNTIGSAAGGGGRNVIAGNKANGITIGSSLATGNSVVGNYIGVGANGTSAVANVGSGVQIANNAFGNAVGGTSGVTLGASPACTGACNTIANNGDAVSQSAKSGIYLDITAGAGNALRANYIFNNLGTGIDLGAPGDTANDASDSDTGPNDLQNKPTLTAANTNEFISGTLASTPSTTFVIDFFRNTSGDGAASEGRVYIGSVNTSTDAGGAASFTFTTTVPLNTGEFITATATATGTVIAPQAVGDTSEFSAAQAVVFAPPTAAVAKIGGRITDVNGTGIAGISVSLLDYESGETYTVTTNEKGLYEFEAVPVGRNYMIAPASERYEFKPANKVISHTDAETDVNFTVQPKIRSRMVKKER